GRRSTLLADHPSELTRSDVQLDERSSTVLRLDDANLVWSIGQCSREHFDDLSNHAHFVSAAACGASGIGVRWRAIKLRTESDGCPPLLSQYETRSLSTFTIAGFVRGL